METAFFYSDESGQHTGGKYFLVAGVAMTKYRLWVRDQLLHAEHISDKRKQDWKGTKNLNVRRRYIEEVLKIEALRGAVFLAEYHDNGKNYWACTVDAIICAIRRFGADRENIIRHQGFNAKTREKLKEALHRAGLDFQIQAGSQEKSAEVRLADALCGYVGLMQLKESAKASVFPDLPEWFIDLKSEAPR